MAFRNALIMGRKRAQKVQRTVITKARKRKTRQRGAGTKLRRSPRLGRKHD
jgi:hypothetical protein